MKESIKSFIIGLLTVLLVAVSGLCIWLFTINHSQKGQISAQNERLKESDDKINEMTTEISQLNDKLANLEKEANASSETSSSDKKEKDEKPADTNGKKKETSTKKEQEKKEAQETADLSDLEHAKTQSLVKQEDVDFTHLENYFQSYVISDELFEKIHGDNKSFKNNCSVPREDLRYIKVLHYDYNGDIRVGELIANAVISEDLLYIFQKLFENNYQIEKMILIEKYDADDDRSVNDNNTSCFNFRYATDSTTLSNHATGCAIDINPLQNPYFRIGEDGKPGWDNVDAGKYWDRTVDPVGRHMINHEDLCYQLFAERGFTWGGDWANPIDYQHFEKPVY